jgi:hypothetical protein
MVDVVMTSLLETGVLETGTTVAVTSITVEPVPAVSEAETEPVAVAVWEPISLTGQTVVPMAMVSVVTWPAGQLVTVAAQEVMV